MATLLDVGLSNAAMAGILALVAAAASRFCRRPALVHSLWLLVLLKLLTPPLVPVDVPMSARWSLDKRDAVVERETEPPDAATAPAALTVGSGGSGAGSVEPGYGGAGALTVPSASRGGSEGSLTGSVAVEVSPALGARGAPATKAHFLAPAHEWRLPPWRPMVAGVWLTGSAAWLVLAGVRIVRFGRLLRHARPAPEAMQAQAEALAKGLGLVRCPGVWLVPGCVSPLLWAVGRAPRLLVPQSLWDQLDDDQQAALLVHELAHLRRRDHWVRRLELVVTGLYWWHPAVWWARRRLREAEEQCCDAWVVWALPASARSYATALLQTLDFLSQARPVVPLAASGAGHLSCLKRRLTMIMQETTPRALSWAGRLAVLGLAAMLLPVGPSRGQDAPPPVGALPPGGSSDVLASGPALAPQNTPAAVPVTGNVIAPPGESEVQDEERLAQLKKAQKEVQRLGDQLSKLQEQFAQAQRRLAELGGGVVAVPVAQPGIFTRGTGGGVIHADNGRVISVGPGGVAPVLAGPSGLPSMTPPGTPPAAAPATTPPAFVGAPGYSLPAAGRPGGATPVPGPYNVRSVPPDTQRRLDELERKLDRVLDELAKLKGTSSGRSRGDDEGDSPRARR